MNKNIFYTIVFLFITTRVSAQTDNYEVYALKFASVSKPIPLSLLVLDAPQKDSINAIFMFWLIKSNNGKNILVDAGFLNDVEEAKDFDVINYLRPDSILQEIGRAHV